MDKDRSIIAQSAGKDAAELVKASGPYPDIAAAIEAYQEAKTAVFNSTLALAGAESIVQAVEGAGTATRQGEGGGNASVGSLVVNSGKHKGKTLDAINAEDPSWLTWAGANLNNPFLKGKVNEYLAQAA